MSGLRIVIVEDDFLIAEYLAQICTELGADVVGRADDGPSARRVIGASNPSHVLMDLRLTGKEDGVDIALWAHDAAPDTKIIFVTGSNEPPSIARIKSDHPHRILIKPIAPLDLEEALS